MEIRNIAIIAHVDHGKTTITDALLRQTGMISDDNVSMDSNALERERGITIYAKNASIFYKDTKINIVDTPGHADFSSEVERVLRSIDSVILVVDAAEGPMPQTRFVLKKAMELGLNPLVVMNKIDKPSARPKEALDEILELFIDLGANDRQLDFKVIYAIGKQGIAKKNLEDESHDMSPLLDAILENIPAAPSDASEKLRMQPFNLGYDNFLGRLGIARIYEGTVKEKQKVFIKTADGKTKSGEITNIFTFRGFQREALKEAYAGDIVMVAGIPDLSIGETICEDENAESLPHIKIDEPTISLGLLVNNSPFSGKDGKYVTNSKLRERLMKELEVNVGMKIDFSNPEYYKVFARGELHVSVLLENMRREGYEVQVTFPEVIIKEEAGKKLEPFEELTIFVPEALVGGIIEKISRRKGIMTQMKNTDGQTRLVFEIPTRGLLGLRNEFMVDTSGEGIMASRFMDFRPHVGEIERHRLGAMVSMATGKAAAYSLDNLQNRGTLYVGANEEVYEGMVIGNVSKGMDMWVNSVKGKHLTNVRSVGEDAIQLTPPMKLDIEKGLEIMNEDELLEITPHFVRLRKKILKKP